MAPSYVPSNLAKRFVRNVSNVSRSAHARPSPFVKTLYSPLTILGGGAGGGGDILYIELLASQDEPKEEDAGDQASAEDDTRTHVTHTYTQGARNAARGINPPLTPAPPPNPDHPSPIPHTRAAARAARAASEPLALTGTTLKFIDAPWVGTHASTPEADISSAIVSVGKGPQENLGRESEIRMGGGCRRSSPGGGRRGASHRGSRRGAGTRRTRSRPPPRQAGRRGATRVGVLTVMRSFPPHRLPGGRR